MSGGSRERDAAGWCAWMWLSVFGCLSAGCPAGSEDPIELQLGTGETRFERMEPAAELPLVAGSQGGFHFWLSMQVRGLSGPRLTMNLELLPEGPSEESFSNVRIGFESVDGEPELLEHIGWPARVLQPWCAVNRPLLVRVTLRDEMGGQVSAMREVVPTAPRGGFAEDCEDGP